MLKFWALSAIAVFCLKEVVSIDYRRSLSGGNPFRIPGDMMFPDRPTERVGDPKKSFHLPPLGDDKIRIACTIYLLIEIFIRSSDRGV